MSFLSKFKGICEGLFSSSESQISVTTDSTDQVRNVEKKKLLESDLAERNVQFVEPIPKEVQTECSVCLNVLLEPYIVECCGHRFCKVCIEKVALARQPCPLCKGRNFQRIPDKHLQRLLQQRKVYCLLKDDGCTWTGEMDKLRKHLGTVEQFSFKSFFGTQEVVVPCEYVPIPCSQCKLLFTNRDMDDHKTACPMREVKCVYCEVYSCPLRDVSDHYENCPSFPVLCPNGCELRTYKREDLEPHLDTECPLEQVMCEYHYAGCEATLLRGEMPEHLDKNPKKHLSLLTTKYKDINGKYENLKENTTESNEIKYLHISNIPAAANSLMLHSRFGQFGTVSRIDMVPSRNEAIVEYANNCGYTCALSAARFPVNLLKHSLRVTPMYSSPGLALAKAFGQLGVR